MCNVVRFPDVDQIEADACDWVARLDNGTLSGRETEKMHDWLLEHVRHAQIMLEMAELLDKLAVLSHIEPLFPLDEPVISKLRYEVVNLFFAFLKPATAVVAAVAVIASGLWMYQLPQLVNQSGLDIANAPKTYSSDIGELKTITLSDSSRITLNSDSQIEVSYSKGKRKMSLARGEAQFDVAHDEDRPFLVNANGNLVRALGTTFNIEITEDSVEVTVTDGVIEVTKVFGTAPQLDDLKKMVAGLSSESQNATSKTVVAGEMLTITEAEEFHVAQIDTVCFLIRASSYKLNRLCHSDIVGIFSDPTGL